jgi:signal transduction histidine kinase
MNSEQTLRALLDRQERERQLVAYEIHDGLAQYLSAAIMHLETYEAGLSEGAGSNSHINEVLRLLREATAEARHLIAGLRPPALDELGLVAAIETLVADARLEIPHVEFAAALGEERLPADWETTLFRIAQESLTNIRRHARASRATIGLTRQPDGGILLQIRDDGRGFDPAAIPPQHFGLEGIKQRAAFLGGTATVTSYPGQGTVIDVQLPPPVDRRTGNSV